MFSGTLEIPSPGALSLFPPNEIRLWSGGVCASRHAEQLFANGRASSGPERRPLLAVSSAVCLFRDAHFRQKSPYASLKEEKGGGGCGVQIDCTHGRSGERIKKYKRGDERGSPNASAVWKATRLYHLCFAAS